MYGEASVIFKEVNPALKDAAWMNRCVSRLRMDWKPLVNQVRIAQNKRILLSMQSMKKVKDAFKDKEFLATTDFVPLGIWDRIVNTLVEEVTKNPPKAELKATDPTAVNQRREDIILLKNKKKYEADINEINEKIGDPPETIGASAFNGNITEFYDMGLEEQDPDDINFYKAVYQRLNFEIAGQSLINNVMKLGRFDEETTRKFVLDILSAKCCCMQTYVDQLSGEIKYRYIYPEEARGIYGDSESGHDDVCSGFETSMTVRDWIGAVGNEFDWNRDWKQLLWAINFYSNSKFTGFIRNNGIYDCSFMDREFCINQMGFNYDFQANLLDWQSAYNYKVYAGYIEFPTMDATATYLAKGEEVLPMPVTYDFNVNRPELKGYDKQSYYQEQYYKTYYLATSIVSQYIYGWGKVYYQHLHGAYDQYARGTILQYRLEGKSAAEISEPYIDFANIAFYRLKWAIYHAKPQKEQYFLPELIKLAKGFQRLYPQTANANGQPNTPKIDTILQDIINYKRQNWVDIRDFPEIDGKPHPVLQPVDGQKGGVDQVAFALQAITQWCESQIAEKIGLNDLRLGQIENPREGYKRTMEATKQSLSSTSYIYRMIQYQKNFQATITLNYAQDIIKFKDSIPYNWLLQLMGEEEFNNIRILEDFAAHRYGIFVMDYSTGIERARLVDAADAALGNKEITVSQWAMVTGTEDYKKAFKLLDFIKRKEEKKKRQHEKEIIQLNHEARMAELQEEGAVKKYMADGEVMEAKIMRDSAIKVALINAKGKVDVKALTNEAEPEKQQSKASGAMQVKEKEAEIENTKSLI